MKKFTQPLVIASLLLMLALLHSSMKIEKQDTNAYAPPPVNITVNNVSYNSYPCSYKVTVRMNYSPMPVPAKILTRTYTIPTGASQVFSFNAPAGTTLGSIHSIKAQPVGCTYFHENLSLTGFDLRGGNCSNCATNTNALTFWDFISLNNYNIWADLGTGTGGN